MDNEQKKKIAENAKKLTDKFGVDFMKEMSQVVYKLGVTTAIRNTGSIDPQVLAEELYKIKDGVLEVEEMKEVVEDTLPKLIEEGWISEEGEVYPETLMIVNHYDHFLKTGEM